MNQKKKRRDGRHRLSMDINDMLYKRVVRAAIKRNITITKWVSRAIFKELTQEEQYQ